MSDDEWVKHALTDSTLAAKVLLNLFRSEPPPPRSGSATSPTLQLEWSVRQRRSKQTLKKKDDPTHASPNTPLSWSGGVSVSGSGSHDGSEETSRPPLKPVDNTRSKIEHRSQPPDRYFPCVDWKVFTIQPSEQSVVEEKKGIPWALALALGVGIWRQILYFGGKPWGPILPPNQGDYHIPSACSFIQVATITPPRRSRRKKTVAELKEEISSHLKENKRLKIELEVVKLKFKNIRTENEMLSRKLESEKDRAMRDSSKRLKFDYQLHSLPATTTAIELNGAISEVHLQTEEAACHTSVMRIENEPNRCSKAQGTAMASCNQTSFALPDLNLPVEDGSGF